MTPRDHIPALNPLELEAALARLGAAPGISKAGKRLIRQMLTAAANPNAEAPEVVIETLPVERRTDIKQTITEVGAVMRGVSQRGERALLQMSDAEWERLVNDANTAN